ncbi:uncharacterized protein LOC125324980 isoform X6 [Corvus hawaiiensis]|uniref:uncharacterized protein LOC125324980 isoform X6 n=1 Tax=Corvus hawaiiensis TaxID=134902 RepID=UPI002019279C|nr:uncharacterized protein LOC125324980 isoform X6 [Corvus hawaiiensis]
MVPGGGGDGTADLRGGGRGGGGTTGDWLRDSGTADLGGGRRGGGGSLLHTCAWRTGLCNDLVSRKFRNGHAGPVIKSSSAVVWPCSWRIKMFEKHLPRISPYFFSTGLAVYVAEIPTATQFSSL